MANAASGVPNSEGSLIHVAGGTYSYLQDSRSGGGSEETYRYWIADGTCVIQQSGSNTTRLRGSWVKFEGFEIDGQNSANHGLYNDWYTESHIYMKNLTIYGCTTGIQVMNDYSIVEGCDLSLISGDVFYTYNDHLIFRGNYIHEMTRTSTGMHQDIWQSSIGNPPDWHISSDVLIERNRIFVGDDSTGELVNEDDWGGYIHLFMWGVEATDTPASGLIIRNNIFECMGGVYIGEQDDVEIYNNLLRGDYNLGGPPLIQCGIHDIGNGEHYHTNSLKVKNNMFIDHTDAVHFDEGVESQDCSNNLFWRYDNGSIAKTGYSSGGGDIDDNPDFVTYNKSVYNVTAGYKLQSVSPARNAGTTITSVTNDYAGISRPQGSAYDIGAYEYEEGGIQVGKKRVVVI